MRILDTFTNKFTALKSRLPQLLKQKEIRAESSDMVLTTNVARGLLLFSLVCFLWLIC